MKIILKIAKAELRTLFYSPIAWFIIFLFYLTLAIMFSITLKIASATQEAMLDLNADWLGFDTGVSFMAVSNIFGFARGFFYLLLPLLTMGVINREFSNGTIKLLYSSPVTTMEIVLGKYLGLALFNVMLIAVFAIFIAALSSIIPHAEYNWFLGVFLGYFLLANAYAAIGLFISCLTSYQVVAAVITFAVFFMLSIISQFGQQYDLVRDVTYFLALPEKIGNVMKGLITSRDLIYFFLVIALFVGFALIKLKSTQESKGRIVYAARYVGLTLMILTLGYFSSRPGYIAYYDLTSRKTNTIHPAIQETVKELDGSALTVTLYTNLLDKVSINGLPQSRNRYIWDVWEPIIRFYPNINFKYEYYYDIMDGDSSYFKKYPGKSLQEIVAIEAEMLDIRKTIFKAPAEIRKQIDLTPEFMRLVMQLEYKGKKEFLRTYTELDYPWPDPHHFAAAFKRLTRQKEVRIAFTSGHLERNPYDFGARDYGWHLEFKGQRKSFINEGIDTDTISLLKDSIPSDLDLLVVADPRTVFTPQEQQKIITWVNNGGNTIFFVEPQKQFILAPILQTIGVHPDAGTIVRPDKHEMPHIFKSMLTNSGNYLAKENKLERFQQYGISGGSVMNEGALNLSYREINGFTVEPIITQVGNDQTWIENGHFAVDSAPPVYSPQEGDLKKNAYVIALKLSRTIGTKEQRIIVAGDADFMKKDRMLVKVNPIYLSLYSWCLYNQYPVYDNFPLAKDRMLSISESKAKLFGSAFVYIGSGIMLLGAIILLVSRKRK